MSISIIVTGAYQSRETSAIAALLPTSEGSILYGPTSKSSSSWKKFTHKSTRHRQIASNIMTVIVSLATDIAEGPTVLMDEELSPENREARAKTLQLAANIEHIYRTDEGFRRWYHEGIEEIEAGHFVTFSEDGWKEE